MGDEYNFRGKRSDENVFLVIRRHPWLLMPIVWFWLIMAGVVLASLYFFGASQVTTYAIFIVLILGFGYTFYIWFMWNNGIYVVSDQRVIRIEQLGIFNREISEAEVDRIQEISTEINGPIRTMMNFGDVKLQTASKEGKVLLKDVASPYDIQQQIVRVQRDVAEGKLNKSRIN